jgi:hypothetical protein
MVTMVEVRDYVATTDSQQCHGHVSLYYAVSEH